MTTEDTRWRILLEVIERERSDIMATAARDTGADASVIEPAFEHILRLASEPDVPPGQNDEAREMGLRFARSGVEGGLVLDAYLSLNWAIWEGATASEDVELSAVVELGDRLMKSIDSAIAAMTRGYVEVEVELAAAHSERRRSVLEELLTGPRATPEDRTRIRRRAERHGLGADDDYRIVLIHLVEQVDETLDEVIDRLEPYARVPESHHRRQPGIRLPVVLDWRGRILVLTSGAWRRERRLGEGLVKAVGEHWTAIESEAVPGVEGLADALSHAEFSLGVAVSLDQRGWIADPDMYALETMYLLDGQLATRAIDRELGPLLADERMGEEYVETLETYLASGQNSRETARRLHLSPRTVTYRLERIEELLGRELDSEASLRLGAALLALRVSRQSQRPR